MRQSKIHQIILYVIIIGLIGFLANMLTACSPHKVFVPIETIKTEYKDKWHRDSIYLQDSVFLKVKNDTVWLEKYRYLYKDKLVRDSVFLTDSVQVPYPIKGDTQYVNRLYWWQQLLMLLGAIAMGIIGYKAYTLVRKLK